MKKSRKNTAGFKSIKRLYNAVSWMLTAAFVFCAIALAGVRIIGLKPFAVLSGSMEPTYKTGSVVYVKKTDWHTLKTGDPITFMLDEKTVATHRIIEVIPDENNPELLRFRTRGDGNDEADGGSVHCKNIIGKPVFSIPYLGYVSAYISKPYVKCVIFFVCALLLLSAFATDLTAKKKKDKKAFCTPNYADNVFNDLSYNHTRKEGKCNEK